MESITLERLSAHISSFSLIMLCFIAYFLFNNDLNFINEFLPSKGKPLFIFVLMSIVVIHELMSRRVRFVNKKIDEILHEIAINRVKGAVSSMYTSFIESGDDFIENEFTIKELSELSSERERLGVNSYTQGKLKFLESKVRRGI